MLTIYDLTCEGLRDPRGIGARARLSWRLGSDEPDTRQTAYRVVVVSLDTGDVVCDSGPKASGRTCCHLDCAGLRAGGVCTWFVTAWDNHGNEVCSMPAAFVRAEADETPTSDLGEQRREFVHTSDARLNAALEAGGGAELRRRIWRDVLGLSCGACRSPQGDVTVLVRPGALRSPLDGGYLSFVCGSVLLPRGLLVLRLEREGGARGVLALPPGVSARVSRDGSPLLLEPGRHEL